MELLDVYQKQVRCIVEYASPVWTGGLTLDEVHQIERVQKTAFAIILGSGYKSYEEALILLDMETVETRRNSINLKFAKFCSQTASVHNMKTRSSENNTILPVQARTTSFLKSPLAYLTKLLIDDSQ